MAGLERSGAGGGPPPTVLDVLAFQAEACGASGSLLYERILRGVFDDARSGGVSAALLAPHDEDPFGSALALRLLGAVHRLVLMGDAPELARSYASAGGDAGEGDPVGAFLDVLRTHTAAVAAGLLDGVQTNEVGRAAVLAGGYAEVERRSGLPLRILEVGASAGLNLRFDRYCYDTGRQVAGEPDSPVRFSQMWVGEPPVLPDHFSVAERRGCDRNPIDPTTPEGRTTLLSFIWPDQVERLGLLEEAIALARAVPVDVERADGAEFVEAQLATSVSGVATVVVHSIVLQYFPPDRRRRLRAAIESAGARATPDAPLAWLRMEPSGDRAELRLTTWPGPGGAEQVLASSGYHGRPIWWGA
jgi:hypothetical protein